MKTQRLGQHKDWVEKLLDSAKGGVGMLHNITKPRPRVLHESKTVLEAEKFQGVDFFLACEFRGFGITFS